MLQPAGIMFRNREESTARKCFYAHGVGLLEVRDARIFSHAKRRERLTTNSIELSSSQASRVELNQYRHSPESTTATITAVRVSVVYLFPFAGSPRSSSHLTRAVLFIIKFQCEIRVHEPLRLWPLKYMTCTFISEMSHGIRKHT